MVLPEAFSTRPAGCGAMLTTRHPCPSQAFGATSTSRLRQHGAVRRHIVHRPLHFVEDENRRPAVMVNRLLLAILQRHLQIPQPVILEENPMVVGRRYHSVQLGSQVNRIQSDNSVDMSPNSVFAWSIIVADRPRAASGSLGPVVDAANVVIRPAEMVRDLVHQHVAHQPVEATSPRSIHSSRIGRRYSQTASGRVGWCITDRSVSGMPS